MTREISCCEKVITYKVNRRRKVFVGAGETVTGPEQAEKIVMEHMKNLPHEEFRVVALDSSNKVLGMQVADTGTVNRCSVYPRKMFSFLLHHNATAAIIAHNHPGGRTDPSREDLGPNSETEGYRQRTRR